MSYKKILFTFVLICGALCNEIEEHELINYEHDDPLLIKGIIWFRYNKKEDSVSYKLKAGSVVQWFLPFYCI